MTKHLITMGQTDLLLYNNAPFNPGGSAIKRLLWFYVNAIFLKSSLLPSSGVKVFWLRLFGAKIGQGVTIKPGVNVKYAWHLTIGNHTWLGEKGIDAGSLPFTGITGEQVYADAPYLRSNLKMFSEEMKADIIAGKVELSPGYLYDVYLQPGVWNGQPYQYVQRNLRGNHLALVMTGRTGVDVAVMDSANDNPQEKSKMTLEELLAAIAKLDEVGKAALMAGINHMSGGEGELPNPGEPAPEVPAVDADVPGDGEEKPVPAAAADADPEKEPAKAMDSAVIKRLNALEAENKALRVQVQGMDSAETIMKQISERNELAQKVSVHIGAFACDSMTAQQVAAYGLEKLGVKDVAKGSEIAVLNGVLAVKSQPTQVAFGMDSAIKTPAKNDVTDAINSL